MPRLPRRALPVLAALVAAVVIGIVLALPAILAGAASGRLRATAAARGYEVRWRRVAGALPARVAFQGLEVVDRAHGDTLFAAESLELDLDPWGLPLGRARIARGALSRATARLPRAATPPDSLAPPAARERGVDPDRALRVRRSFESLVRLLVAPARDLPLLTLADVTLHTGRDDALLRGIRIQRLDLTPRGGDLRLAASGAVLGERETTFEVALDYQADDSLAGSARLGIPDPQTGRSWPVVVGVEGGLQQDRGRERVVIADGTRIRFGRVPFVVAGSLERGGPACRLRLAADGLDEAMIKESLPPPVLGPLRRVGVRGRFDYRLTFDLDFAQPDSVGFTADVIPHGLALDSRRTTLGLLGLDGPFRASIHLPRDRVVTRELSDLNPHYRSLEAISPDLVHAVVTNEDGAFFRHRGFNPEAVRDAIADNLAAGAWRRGAGTITMQLARNLYLGHRRTLSRKFQEVVLAWVIENLTPASKPRLLEIYLNIIEWGPDVNGANEAARWFFDRDASQLSLDEALFLSTIVPSPARWRARFDQAGVLRPWARAQMRFIARAMVAKGWLEPDRLPEADSIAVVLTGPARRVLFPGDTLLVGPPADRLDSGLASRFPRDGRR